MLELSFSCIMQKNKYLSNIKKMYTVKLFFYMHFFGAILVPFFTDWGGLNFSKVMYLNAWFMLWNFLLEVPTGTVADHFGRKASVILGTVAGVICMVTYVSYPHIVIFMLAEIIFALSLTLISGADNALIYDSLKSAGMEEKSKEVFGKMESFKLAGIIIGALIGAPMAKFLGLRMTFFLVTIPLFISFLISLTLKEVPYKVENGIHEKYGSKMFDGLKFFFKNKILMILTFDMAIVSAAAWIIIWFYQPMLKERGVDIIWFGLVHALMCVAQIVVMSNYRHIENLIGAKQTVLFIASMLTAFFYTVLGFSKSPMLAILSIVFAAAFGLTRGPLFTSYLNKFIPSEKRATVLSVTTMFQTFAIVIINVITGLLSKWSLNYTMIIISVFLIVVTIFSKIEEEFLID